jgi:trimethylamine--corrinoid protein Co-methyltransferase
MRLREVGRHLGLPTQAYIALSDAKHLDAQAGAETAMARPLRPLGYQLRVGPGMLDFENAFSLETGVRPRICGMALRLREGIQAAQPSIVPVLQELVAEGHLLISEHTRQHACREISLPSAVIDRASRARWTEEGGRTLLERAGREAAALEDRHRPPRHAPDVERALTERMHAEARRFGMERLPERPCAA